METAFKVGVRFEYFGKWYQVIGYDDVFGIFCVVAARVIKKTGTLTGLHGCRSSKKFVEPLTSVERFATILPVPK